MSKVISFKIPKPQKEFVRFQVDEGRHFYDKLHQHPEWQLTLILEGKGQLMVGDYLGRFGPGEVYFLSSNIPHVFRSDEEYFSKENEKKSVSNTVFFDFEALGKSIWEVEEFHELRQMVGFNKGCYAISGKTQVLISRLIHGFGSKSGMQKLLTAFDILQALQQSRDKIQLNKLVPHRDYSEAEGRRMGNVTQFILAESHRNISLQEVADVGNMTKEAFCRFFKDRTGKTYTEFVNELRIHKACHLLRETDLSVAQIAYQIGFQNLSYFNRAFKRYTQHTPNLFRKQVLAIQVPVLKATLI